MFGGPKRGGLQNTPLCWANSKNSKTVVPRAGILFLTHSQSEVKQFCCLQQRNLLTFDSTPPYRHLEEAETSPYLLNWRQRENERGGNNTETPKINHTPKKPMSNLYLELVKSSYDLAPSHKRLLYDHRS